MDKAYLVLFNADETRKKTYACGVFYKIEEPQPIKEINEQGEESIIGYTEEQIVPLVNGFNVQDVLNAGGKWLTNEEYLNLLQTKVYKEGADNA